MHFGGHVRDVARLGCHRTIVAEDSSKMGQSVFGASLAVIAAAVLLAVSGLLAGCGGIDGTFPPPPSDFLLSSPADSSTVVGTTPTLVWTNSTGQTQYYVQISEDPTFANNVYTALANANTTSYTVLASTLTASTKYYWQVRAVNNSGPTTASNAPFSFTTTFVPASTAFLLTSPTNSASGVGVTPTLVWNDAADELSYTVQIDTDLAFSTPYNVLLPANTTSYVVTASVLTTGTRYYWQGLATNSGGPVKAANAPFSFTP